MSAPSDSPEQSDALESHPVADSTTISDATESADVSTPTASPEHPQNADFDADSPESADGEDATDDPRMNDEYVRRLPEFDLTLVGVVHDHPASVHRARATVCERDPDVVALEAPPLATPLYRVYAEDSRTPPAFGGEMSAAAQAADECGAEVVGIDGPSADFFARLARNCWREDASLGTLRRVASGVASVTRHALVCRVAAGVAERTSLRVEVDSPVQHDCEHSDPPEVQARDERQQASRSQSLLRAFDPPRPVRLRDETREECMVENLDALRSQGETVAVVGLDHLDAVAEQLRQD